jgi:hypothetical protein
MRNFTGLLLAVFVGLLGASRAEAVPILFTTQLTGANETPPNGSPGTGFATVVLDDDQLFVDLEFQDLIGGSASAAHIHCCVPAGTMIGVAVGFPGFPAATSGVYSHTFDLLDPTIYSATFLNDFGGGTAAGARDALVSGLFDDLAYVNIHTPVYPGGEIRGQLHPVPEPTTLLLTGSGLLAVSRLVLTRRSRREAARRARLQ